MLYTAATRPQVLVTVDGMSAACANLNCDYMYVDTDALVTSQAINGNTLTIQG
jgi:endonuclease/exonuclease/phosphatase family metal-dependent hydrolase